MSYQFIVIVLNEERRKHMNNMFKNLYQQNDESLSQMNSQFKDVTFLEASTIENSKEYIDNYPNINNHKFICCANSHILALKYATESNYDFSIILEDDVLFHNNNFLKAIEELIYNWNLYSTHGYNMINIGWIPTMNYSRLSELPTLFPKLTSINNMKLLYSHLFPGTQGYIVKNSTISNYIEYLFQPTFNDLYQKLITHPNIITNCNKYNKNILDIDCFVSIDSYLYFLLSPLTLFPHLVIESSIKSSLGHNNIEHYWNKFYKNFEIEKTNYFSDVYMEPLLISYENDNTNSNTQDFVDTLNCHKWNYHILGNGEKWINFIENKIKSSLNCLKTIHPKQVVVISNARDVVCLRKPSNFINEFKKYDKKIVVSMELFAEGLMDYDPNKSYFQVTWIEKYWKHYNIDHTKIMRKFVNSGLVSGYAEDLITCFQWMIDNDYTDDQKGLGAYMNEFPELFYADIDADILHTMGAFVNAGLREKNIQNQDAVTLLELTGIKSYFIHIPGIGISKGQELAYNEIKKILKSLNQTKLMELYPDDRDLFL